jgi:uncharacterized protein (TIGR02145 family)
MMAFRISLFLVFIILFNFSNIKAQQSFVYANDSVILSLNSYTYGNLIWQKSVDGINWNDISGAVSNPSVVKPNTTNFYRAKITYGSCNPYYSDVIKIDVIPFNCGDTLIDYRDNMKYSTVQIGNKCWMAKNLNVGNMINNGTETPSNNNIIEKYCYFNDVNNCNAFGGLYAWDEMMAYVETESVRGICPHGWHIPSDFEWIDLELALGMDNTVVYQFNTWRGSNQGTQLKAGGSSGYEALLSGIAIPGGMFNAIGQYEYMYSSTPYGSNAWRRCLRTGDNTVGRWNTFPRYYGMSVRCIKD